MTSSGRAGRYTSPTRKDSPAGPSAEFLFVAVILFYIVFSVLGIDVKFTRYKLVTMQTSVVLLCVLMLLERIWRRESYFKISNINLPVALFGAVIIVHYLVSKDRIIASDQFVRNILCIAVFFAMSNASAGRKNLVRFLWAWSVVSVVVGLNALSSHLALGNPYNIVTVIFSGGADFFENAGKITGIPLRFLLGFDHYGPNERPFATFGNPTFFAAYLVLIIPVIFSFSLTRNNLKAKAFLWCLCALLIFALFYTGTRAAWVGFAVSVPFYVYAMFKARAQSVSVWIKKNIAVSVVILILSIPLIALMFPWEKARQNIYRPTQRPLIWRDTAVMALKNPMGIGLGAFHIYFPRYASQELKQILPPERFIVNYAHNEYLEIWAETGLLGLVFFMWVLMAFFSEGLSALKRPPQPAGKKESDPLFYHRPVYIAGFLAGAVALLVNNMFSVDMRFTVSAINLFFVIGMVVWLASDEKTLLNFPRPFFAQIAATFLVFLAAGRSAGYFFAPFRAHADLSRETSFFSDDPSLAKDEAALRQAIQQQPENYDAHYQLAWLYAKQKKFNEAAYHFKRAGAIRPDSEGAFNNLANIYFETGRRKEAIEYYKKAIAISPRKVDAHFNLGYCYYTMGMLKEAADEFKIVLALDPNNAKAKIMIDKMVQ